MFLSLEFFSFFFHFLQLTLSVRDNGNPEQSSSIPVTINVIRNLFSPVFPLPYYTVPMSYLTSVNTIIFTVTATDADTDVRVYTWLFLFLVVCGLGTSLSNELIYEVIWFSYFYNPCFIYLFLV